MTTSIFHESARPLKSGNKESTQFLTIITLLIAKVLFFFAMNILWSLTTIFLI